jgi:hypothetical protein
VQDERDVTSAGEPVHESVKTLRVGGGIELPHETSGMGTENREQTRDAGADRADASVGEPRREKPDDLTVLGFVEPTHDADGIGVEEAEVVAPAESIERAG